MIYHHEENMCCTICAAMAERKMTRPLGLTRRKLLPTHAPPLSPRWIFSPWKIRVRFMAPGKHISQYGIKTGGVIVLSVVILRLQQNTCRKCSNSTPWGKKRNYEGSSGAGGMVFSDIPSMGLSLDLGGCVSPDSSFEIWEVTKTYLWPSFITALTFQM